MARYVSEFFWFEIDGKEQSIVWTLYAPGDLDTQGDDLPKIVQHFETNIIRKYSTQHIARRIVDVDSGAVVAAWFKTQRYI